MSHPKMAKEDANSNPTTGVVFDAPGGLGLSCDWLKATLTHHIREANLFDGQEPKQI